MARVRGAVGVSSASRAGLAAIILWRTATSSAWASVERISLRRARRHRFAAGAVGGAGGDAVERLLDAGDVERAQPDLAELGRQDTQRPVVVLDGRRGERRGWRASGRATGRVPGCTVALPSATTVPSSVGALERGEAWRGRRSWSWRAPCGGARRRRADRPNRHVRCRGRPRLRRCCVSPPCRSDLLLPRCAGAIGVQCGVQPGST